LSALALSILAFSAQVVAWARGPSITLLPPERVALYGDVAPDQTIIVRIAAPMSYANLAQQQFGALVVAERAVVTVGNLKSEQIWNAFGEMHREKDALRIGFTAQALPQALPGQAFVSHLTLFTPARRNCTSPGCNPNLDYVSPSRFQAAAAKSDRILFDFSVATIDGKNLSQSCEVTVDDLARRTLAKLTSSAFYALCRTKKDD
jgi:hypothetical protein